MEPYPSCTGDKLLLILLLILTLFSLEGKEKYCVEIPNRFATLEDLDAEVKINSALETESRLI
jgi:hypothetical protein